MEMLKKLIKNKKFKICVLPAIAILILAFALIFSSKGGSGLFGNTINLESEMTTMVTSFYDKNIKGKIVGVHKQIVTLEDLQKQEYDISHFINAKCSLESFSYVVLEDPKETDVEKIKYTIEHHLDCEKLEK